MKLSALLTPVGLFFATSLILTAHGDVVESTDRGFDLKITTQIAAGRKQVYNDLTTRIGQWWDPQHTWSGDAANLQLQTQPGGRLVEKMPQGGFVEHLAVVAVQRNKMLRLRGGLGPLQEHAVAGSLTIELADDGDGTRVTLTYRVGGYVPQGLKEWAAPVDGVLSAQLARLRSFVEDGGER